MAQSFYDSAQWQRVRRQVLRASGYTCERCGADLDGQEAHVHHRIALREAIELSLDFDNLIALCRRCHATIHADEKHKGVLRGADINGAPLDEAHPWNKR